MPIAIIILLILNQKKDVAKISTIILSVFGVLRIVALVLGVGNLFAELPKYDEVMAMTSRVCSMIISISTIALVFLSAKSIKNKQTSKYMKVFNIIIIVVTLFYGALSYITKSSSSTASNTAFISLLTHVVIGFSLSTLPKTIYDYENCEFVTKTKLVVICVLAISIGLFTALFGILSNDSENSDGGKYRCNICGGDGWDSENNCSCVWCGGDGKTHWNP
jgi:heme A synthase